MELDLTKANKFARMAGLAYKDSDAAKEFERLGYNQHRLLDNNGSQCHVCLNDKELVFCFRGTEPDQLSDILADLNVIPRKSKSDGWVHSGFRGELDKIWPTIEQIVNMHEDHNIYICGHSLGAAMAIICTSRLPQTVELYTFGSPRAGTRSFVKNIKTKHWRFVNNNDVVTGVPLALMGYKHHGNLCYINHYGKIRKMTLWQRIKDKFRGFRDGALDGVADHGMHNYINYTIKEG